LRFTPRKEEIEPLAALLDSGEYDSPEALAKAVLAHVADLLWFRNWHVLAVREGALFGPFASDAEGAAFGRKYSGVLVPSDAELWRVMTVYGLGNSADHRAGGGFGYCADIMCGHPAYTHSMAGPGRGPCVLASCRCAGYEQLKSKPRAKK
jgi:hypothetical protein